MIRLNLGGGGIDEVKLLCSPTREAVHGCKRGVEAIPNRVDGGEVDRVTLELQQPT